MAILFRTLPLVRAVMALTNGRAQTQWTAVPADVARTLWGVCWGGGNLSLSAKAARS